MEDTESIIIHGQLNIDSVADNARMTLIIVKEHEVEFDVAQIYINKYF